MGTFREFPPGFKRRLGIKRDSFLSLNEADVLCRSKLCNWGHHLTAKTVVRTEGPRERQSNGDNVTDSVNLETSLSQTTSDTAGQGSFELGFLLLAHRSTLIEGAVISI